MGVPSFEFVGFVAVVAVVLALGTAPAWRRSVLLVANVLFLATFASDPRALVPLLVFVGFGYLAVEMLRRSHRTSLGVAVAVIAFVAAFAILKQYSFVPRAAYLRFDYQTIGISYIFFRVLHLIIDVGQKTLDDPLPPIDYVNYTLNFTSLVAGPIDRYPGFRERAVVAPRPVDLRESAAALERAALGFAKVVLFAPPFLALQGAALVHSATATNPMRVADAATVVLAYPIFLYLNFSGYMDVVIAAARFLGLDLPENFDKPFVATGFIDFWSRWHITLSTWLKTYVYSPLFLAAIRRFPSRRAEPYLGVFAFFVTFFLVGLWHGSTNMFIVYGILQGLGVSLNKAAQLVAIARLGRKRYRAFAERPVIRSLSRGLTYAYFAVTLLWFTFDATGLAAFARHLSAGDVFATVFVVWFVATLGTTLYVRAVASVSHLRERLGSAAAMRFVRIGWSTTLVVAVASVLVVLEDSGPKIVYRAF